jgi:hypothetical protein
VISDNDSTSITVSEPWSEPPDGMHYEIYIKERRVSTTAYDNAGNVLSTTRQLTYPEPASMRSKV